MAQSLALFLETNATLLGRIIAHGRDVFGPVLRAHKLFTMESFTPHLCRICCTWHVASTVTLYSQHDGHQVKCTGVKRLGSAETVYTQSLVNLIREATQPTTESKIGDIFSLSTHEHWSELLRTSVATLTTNFNDILNKRCYLRHELLIFFDCVYRMCMFADHYRQNLSIFLASMHLPLHATEHSLLSELNDVYKRVVDKSAFSVAWRWTPLDFKMALPLDNYAGARPIDGIDINKLLCSMDNIISVLKDFDAWLWNNYIRPRSAFYDAGTTTHMLLSSPYAVEDKSCIVSGFTGNFTTLPAKPEVGILSNIISESVYHRDYCYSKFVGRREIDGQLDYHVAAVKAGLRPVMIVSCSLEALIGLPQVLLSIVAEYTEPEAALALRVLFSDKPWQNKLAAADCSQYLGHIAEIGDLKEMQRLLPQMIVFTADKVHVTIPNITDIAAEHGHLDVVNWLLTSRYKSLTYDDELSQDTFAAAAKSGSLDVLQSLTTFNRSKGDAQVRGIWLVCQKAAAKYGHKHILEWIKDKRGEFSKHCMTAAIEGDQIDIYMWLLERGFTTHNKHADTAVDNSSLQMLKLLAPLRHEQIGYDKILEYALVSGRDDTAAWLLSESLADQAMQDRDKYLSLPQTNDLCHFAARHHRLIFFEWLERQGRLTPELHRHAIDYKWPELMRWLLSRKIAIPADAGRDIALHELNLEILQLLHEHKINIKASNLAPSYPPYTNPTENVFTVIEAMKCGLINPDRTELTALFNGIPLGQAWIRQTRVLALRETS